MQATGGLNSLSLSERFDENRAKYDGDGSPSDYMRVLQYNLERTFHQNTQDQFQQTVDLLCQAECRYIIGFRGCLGVAIQCA